MVELGFADNQVHPHMDGKYPNFSVDSLIIEGVLSRFSDPIQILSTWFRKIKIGGHAQIVDFDLDSILIHIKAGTLIEPDKVHEALYGNLYIQRKSCLKWEQVVKVAQDEGLKINSIFTDNLKFQVEVSRESP